MSVCFFFKLHKLIFTLTSSLSAMTYFKEKFTMLNGADTGHVTTDLVLRRQIT